MMSGKNTAEIKDNDCRFKPNRRGRLLWMHNDGFRRSNLTLHNMVIPTIKIFDIATAPRGRRGASVPSGIKI